VLFQAGDSEFGRNLGARFGDAIFTHAATIEQGQVFYADIKGRAAALGRHPNDIVILPGFSVTVGDTDAHAIEIEQHWREHDHSFEQAVAELGRAFGWHDFRQYDLDAPFPVEALEHARLSFYTQAKRITDLATSENLSLRETVLRSRQSWRSPFVGSAQTVADEIERWFNARALDGLNIHSGHPSQFRRFTQEVVPLLQERGLFRKDYAQTTLRGHLGLPISTNIRSAQAEAAE
jgi:alkanesulfonate monooxygenase SsuD/methylene tetrahydromethanopterin reductase-like flavin-dependent oxidoreductase (luciferase family)